MDEQVVYLMRGLPACGKSFTARRLARPNGIVLETDEYFYSQVGTDPNDYNWAEPLFPAAQRWNFARFCQALAKKISPIVVDRGNGLNEETFRYASLARDHGYDIELMEPESPWWAEIRGLLDDKSANWPVLEAWAIRLAQISQATHSVPLSTILRWMRAWKPNLSVKEILSYKFVYGAEGKYSRECQ